MAIMLKLEVYPSFLASCFFQLQKSDESWIFTFCKNRFEYKNEEANFWQVNVPHSKDIENVIDLSIVVVTEAQKDERIILDGITINCIISQDEVERRHEFRCPNKNSNEFLLVDKILELGQKTIKEQVFINYIELLEGYFTGKVPIKFFDENPNRLRIYGSLSTLEKEGLEKMIAKVSNNESLLVDMTNFERMGTLLYESFRPLNNVKDLKFIASECAAEQLKEIGFDKEKIKIVY
jgi:hypothetical protein